MIRSDDNRVVIAGTPICLMQDLSNILSAVKETLGSRMGEERADEIISLCGRYAYAEDEKEKEMYADRMAEIIIEKQSESNG